MGESDQNSRFSLSDSSLEDEVAEFERKKIRAQKREVELPTITDAATSF